MKRHILIFDVHGCIDELDKLIHKLQLRHDDQLIFGGDLLDKGPDSLGVVRRVAQLAKYYDVTLILGNHEEKYARWLKHEERRKKTNASNPITHKEVVKTGPLLSEEDIDFLSSAVLYHKIPELDTIVVHGGVPAWCKFLPKSPETISHMGGKQRKKYMGMCRLRYETIDGRFVMLGKQMPTDKFWAETYDGRFGQAYFGHQPFMQDAPKKFPHAVGMDLGCAYGGNLVAAILTEDKKIKYVTVKATQVYKQMHRSLNN